MLTARSSAGTEVTDLYPNLIGLQGKTFSGTDPELLADADLLFTALPHGESAKLAAQLPKDLKVIDLGADFRLTDEQAWTTFYKSPYAGHWVYGLPELPGARDAIAAASRVAAPGCYATASILALAPLLAAGLVEPADIVIVAASGTSGAGRTLRHEYLATEVMGSMRAYAVGGTHRHTPEIEQAFIITALVHQPSDKLREAAGGLTVSFTPTLAPMSRGILATCTARLAAGVTAADLRAALAEAYAGEKFVHLLPEGRWPATASVSGSNAAQLQVTADMHAGRAVVVSAIDNLGKGAAGQAVQCANLMLGLPEAAGLSTVGVHP